MYINSRAIKGLIYPYYEYRYIYPYYEYYSTVVELGGQYSIYIPQASKPRNLHLGSACATGASTLTLV